MGRDGAPAAVPDGRHLLLREDGAALAILGQLIADGAVGATELASWPIFDRLRQAGVLGGGEPGGASSEADAITQDRYGKLINLAVERVDDAERCAAAGCYPAACVMAGAGTEAAIMAHVCVCAAEVRAAGMWRESRAAPFDWSLEQLIQIAVAMGWLPATRVRIAADRAIDKLTGEIGDAVRFVQYARNLVAHPGKYVLDTPWLPTLGEDEYTIVYGVTRAVMDHLHTDLANPDDRP